MALPLLNFKGFWYATSNTPSLQDGVGTLGDCYHIFNFNGTVILDTVDRDLGSGNKSWINNYYIYYDGSTWNMTDSTGSGIIPNLQQVLTAGNIATLPIYSIGYGATTTQTGSTTYNAMDTDFTILCDCSFADTNIILPIQSSTFPVRPGRMFAIKKTKGVFRVNVTVDTGLLIDGVPIIKLANVNDSIIVQLNAISGQEYNILAAYP